MTRTTANSGPSKILMLAPAAVVLIVYVYVFHSPQQNRLRRAKVRADTLTGAQPGAKHDHVHDHDHVQEHAERSSLRRTKRKLTAELSQEQLRQKSSLQQLTALRRELLSPSRPVATVQNVTRIFALHRVRILESQPDQGSAQKSRQVVKTLIGLLAPNKNGQLSTAPKTIHREVYRLKLVGRFADVRSALAALATEQQNVVTLSLEMARLKLAHAGQTQTPTWYLTILV